MLTGPEAESNQHSLDEAALQGTVGQVIAAQGGSPVTGSRGSHISEKHISCWIFFDDWKIEIIFCSISIKKFVMGYMKVGSYFKIKFIQK